jgi:SAM-dependent methyltransferase
MERVDLLDMPFADESVDLLIANHVLEHVDDDLRAIAEIGRVLAKDGVAILQTPYSRMLQHTWEDAGIVGAEARLQAYGQEDHVRLYGRDIFERFASGQLVADIGSHASLLPDVDAERFGVNSEEPLFLYRKRS